MTKFELVIPAYNEAKNLESVIRRSIEAAKSNKLSSSEFCLIVVQNGSNDESEYTLSKLLQAPDLACWFKVITVHQNQGYGWGLWQGLAATRSEIIGWSHADQQCDPNDAISAFRILETMRDQKVLIKGERYKRQLKDRIVSRVFEMLARIILGIKVYEMNAQPKVFNRNLLANLKNPPKTFAFDLYVLYRASKEKYTIRNIPVDFPPRIHGISKWASNFFGRYKTIFGIIGFMLKLRKSEGKA